MVLHLKPLHITDLGHYFLQLCSMGWPDAFKKLFYYPMTPQYREIRRKYVWSVVIFSDYMEPRYWKKYIKLDTYGKLTLKIIYQCWIFKLNIFPLHECRHIYITGMLRLSRFLSCLNQVIWWRIHLSMAMSTQLICLPLFPLHAKVDFQNMISELNFSN